MFHISKNRMGLGFRWLLTGFLLLSVATVVVTIAILLEVRDEQKIVLNLQKHSSPADASGIEELAGDLRWQYRLGFLLLGEAIIAAVARVLLVRAYVSTSRSLRETKGLATDILASMDLGVATTDRKGVITSINPWGVELLGREQGVPEIWMGQFFRNVDERFEFLDAICRRVLDHDDVIRDQDYSVHINRHNRTLRCGCTPLRDENGVKLGSVLQIRDITEQAFIQERMLRMERHMGLASLAAGLQHEIKNPLSALSLHVQLLDEQLRQTNAAPEITETISVLRTETARINAVLQGFGNYASDSKPGRILVDVGDLVKKLVRLIAPQADQQNVQVVVEFPPHPIEPDELDSDRIEQVLLNLAVNALHAMPSGGKLTIAVSQSRDTLQIEVTDTGAGIPPDIQKSVFDPYFTTRPTGTGMGLAISEKIVSQHNGTIDLESGPEGSTFTVRIPRQQVL